MRAWLVGIFVVVSVAIVTISPPAARASGASATVAPANEEPFVVTTDNLPQARIAGTLWRGGGGGSDGYKPRGTLIMCHGFGRSMWDFRGYRWIADREHFNVVRFDFRNHGQSSHDWRLPTLGYYEIYDLKAVVDWAERQHLQKPFLCYGHSMGAAIALRWAGQDARIAGVLAQSPFRNALDATREFRPNDVRVQLASTVFVHGGFARMLQQVDVPSAVGRRDDLILWLTTGERDYFGEADQRAILAGSASPGRLKRLLVIPSARHGEQWRWRGNDDLIRSFLTTAADEPLQQRLRAALVGGMTILVVSVLATMYHRRRGAAGGTESTTT